MKCFPLTIDRGGDPNGGTNYGSGMISSTATAWPARIQPYLKSRQIFICPSTSPDASSSTWETRSYWGAEAMFRKEDNGSVALSSILKPAETPYIYDNLNGTQEARRIFRPHWNPNLAGQYSSLGSFTTAKPGTHFEGMNASYADGHVKWQKLANLYLQLCPEWTSGNAGQTDCTTPQELS